MHEANGKKNTEAITGMQTFFTMKNMQFTVLSSINKAKGLTINNGFRTRNGACMSQCKLYSCCCLGPECHKPTTRSHFLLCCRRLTIHFPTWPTLIDSVFSVSSPWHSWAAFADLSPAPTYCVDLCFPGGRKWLFSLRKPRDTNTPQTLWWSQKEDWACTLPATTSQCSHRELHYFHSVAQFTQYYAGLMMQAEGF